MPKVVLFGCCLGEQIKVAVMGEGMEEGEEDDTPGDGLVECDGLVEGYDAVEGGRTKPGDEGPADREENDARVDMKNQSSSTGDRESDADDCTRGDKVVRVEEVEECESKESDVDQNP